MWTLVSLGIQYLDWPYVVLRLHTSIDSLLDYEVYSRLSVLLNIRLVNTKRCSAIAVFIVRVAVGLKLWCVCLRGCRVLARENTISGASADVVGHVRYVGWVTHLDHSHNCINQLIVLYVDSKHRMETYSCCYNPKREVELSWTRNLHRIQ